MSWQRPNIASRVNREVHARFWERPEVKFLRATRPSRRFHQFGHFRFGRERTYWSADRVEFRANAVGAVPPTRRVALYLAAKRPLDRACKRERERIVTYLATHPLTYVTQSVTYRESRSSRDLSRGYFRKRSESGPRTRIYNPRPGGSGHHSRRYYGRCGRCSPWTGIGEGG
jgi:hypothetical protein